MAMVVFLSPLVLFAQDPYGVGAKGSSRQIDRHVIKNKKASGGHCYFYVSHSQGSKRMQLSKDELARLMAQRRRSVLALVHHKGGLNSSRARKGVVMPLWAGGK